MKTIEEIISQYEPNREYPSYYHESKIIEMIKEAHRQACEAQREQDRAIAPEYGLEIHQAALIELK